MWNARLVLWNFFHTFKIEVFKNPKNPIENIQNATLKNCQIEFWTHLVIFVVILVWGHRISGANFRKFAPEIRCPQTKITTKITRCVQNSIWQFFSVAFCMFSMGFLGFLKTSILKVWKKFHKTNRAFHILAGNPEGKAIKFNQIHSNLWFLPTSGLVKMELNLNFHVS